MCQQLCAATIRQRLAHLSQRMRLNYRTSISMAWMVHRRLKRVGKENSLIAATGGQSPIEIGKESAKVALSVLNKEKYARITYEETF